MIHKIIKRNFLIAAFVISSMNLVAQLPCECNTACPDPVGFNNCGDALIPATLWYNNGAPLTHTVDVTLNGVQEVITGIEVDFCCRIRANCPSFFKEPVGYSCELTIRCIRIPKEHLMGLFTLGEPPPFGLGQELVTKAVEQIICNNPCEFGIPATSSDIPYEWVITVPACFDWQKTANSHYCLEPCSDDYCVNALLIGNDGGEAFLLNQIQTTWTDHRGGNPIKCYQPCREFLCHEYTGLGCLQD